MTTPSRSATTKRRIRKAKKVWAGRIKVAFVAIAGFVILMAILHPGSASAKMVIQEDSPQWDCTMMGNRICGPDNAQGAPAGLYDQGGVLIASWDEWLAALNNVDHNAKSHTAKH